MPTTWVQQSVDVMQQQREASRLNKICRMKVFETSIVKQKDRGLATILLWELVRGHVPPGDVATKGRLSFTFILSTSSPSLISE
jgi:hypothetical protein